MEERTLKLRSSLTKTTLIPPNLPRAQEMPLSVGVGWPGQGCQVLRSSRGGLCPPTSQGKGSAVLLLP